jgi:anhydro-N-acetylmuramic acid kinase
LEWNLQQRVLFWIFNKFPINSFTKHWKCYVPCSETNLGTKVINLQVLPNLFYCFCANASTFAGKIAIWVMIYNVIGLMSGSSLDGLDIAFFEITDVRNDWSYELKHHDCISFDGEMTNALKCAATLSVPEFLKLHTTFGRWMGKRVNAFIEKYALFHKVHFIASHGHTVFHDPKSQTSTQIGDGASIAAITGLTTIADLRNMDVALGGQGAPIVPIADRYFFKDYDFCLNIGGICNVTVNKKTPIAFDIAPANQVLNHYAMQIEMPYDMDGALAAAGTVNSTLKADLNRLDYYQQVAPKSLANSYTQYLIEIVDQYKDLRVQDILATLCSHIAEQIKTALAPYTAELENAQMLVTGGGAFNKYFMQVLQEELKELQITAVVPDEAIVKHKEALAMALIGVLRWREEANVLSSVTGASRDSIGGAVWLGNT